MSVCIYAHGEAWLPLLPSKKVADHRYCALMSQAPEELACRFSSSAAAPFVCVASPGCFCHPEAGMLQHTQDKVRQKKKSRAADGERAATSAIAQHHLLVVHQPAETGKLHIVPGWSLDCDVPAVPVIVHPELPLLNFHQNDLSQVLPRSDVIGIHLRIKTQPLNEQHVLELSVDHLTSAGRPGRRGPGPRPSLGLVPYLTVSVLSHHLMLRVRLYKSIPPIYFCFLLFFVQGVIWKNGVV